jgi:hypothetical protein
MSQCGSQTWVTSHDSSQWAGFIWVTEHVTVLDHRSALSLTQFNGREGEAERKTLPRSWSQNWRLMRGVALKLLWFVQLCCKMSFVSDQHYCCVDSTACMFTFWGFMMLIFKSCSWQVVDFPATCLCQPLTLHLVWILPVVLCGCETWWPIFFFF